LFQPLRGEPREHGFGGVLDDPRVANEFGPVGLVAVGKGGDEKAEHQKAERALHETPPHIPDIELWSS